MENKQSCFKIKIEAGNEHRSISMDIYDDTAFFYDAYKRAARAVTHIVARSNEYTCRGMKQRDGCGREEPCHSRVTPFSAGSRFALSEYHSNIVAFCADRGQGKTSAMLSVAAGLKNMTSDGGSREHSRREKHDFWNSVMTDNAEQENNPVLGTHFELLDVIDPTSMTENDSFMRMVISKMFKSASDRWSRYVNEMNEDGYCSGTHKELKEKLAEQFLACFKGVNFLKKTNGDLFGNFDDLNALAEFGDSSNFKESFSELVRLYLRFMSFRHTSEDAMLVVMIDDADLNTQNAFIITEEIRKYLMIPRVVVLMSVHIGTLSRIIEQHFVEQYRTLIDKGTDQSLTERCHAAMERYLDKFIPFSRRIHLPSLSGEFKDSYSRVRLAYLDKNNNDMLRCDERLFNNKRRKADDSYQDLLIMAVYRKTGIILIRPDHYLHEFLPNNLRELNHFLYYLNSMEDVIRFDENGNRLGTFKSILSMLRGKEKPTQEQVNAVRREIDFQLGNLRLFSDYFIHMWCPLHLSHRQLKVIESIDRNGRHLKNLLTTDLLADYANRRISTREQEDIKRKHVPLSDVIFALYTLRHLSNPKEHYPLVSAIRMYYSIYLRQTALNDLRSWVGSPQDDHAGPFRELIGLTGERIFPLMYYQKKHIPIILFHFLQADFDKGDEKAFDALYHFTCRCSRMPRKRMLHDFSLKNFLIEFHQPSFCMEKGNIRIDSDYQYFDFCRPFTSILKADDFVGQYLFSSDKNYPNYSLDIPESILNLLCNIDLQELLFYKYFRKAPLENEENAVGESSKYELIKSEILPDFYNMYRSFDSSINAESTISLSSSLQSIIGIVDDKTKPIDTEILSGFIRYYKKEVLDERGEPVKNAAPQEMVENTISLHAHTDEVFHLYTNMKFNSWKKDKKEKDDALLSLPEFYNSSPGAPEQDASAALPDSDSAQDGASPEGE